MNSPTLKWIEKNKDILCISALEKFLKIPNRLLYTYFKTGHLQNSEKWLPLIEQRMKIFMRADARIIREFVVKLLAAWQQACARARKVSPDIDASYLSNVYNGKQEQMLDDLKLLNDIVIKYDPTLAGFLHGQCKKYIPHLADAFRNAVPTTAAMGVIKKKQAA